MFLVNSYIVNCLKLQEIDINNNVNEANFEPIENDVNNNNLIKLINKVTRELYDESKQQSLKIKRNRNFNNLHKTFVKPNWLKLHQKHGGLSDQLHGLTELYEDSRSEPNDFSKVYLILNPESSLTSSDVRDLSNMVSSMFSNSESNKKAKYKYNDETMRRYKGFIMRDKRRRFKESKETFAKDSIERDYKPKRVRSDYGGSGRTAIPYIRHRGDIYERD